MWQGCIYIDHCTMEGLSSVGNIQGGPADMLIVIFTSKSISPALKWVDNFVIFHVPSSYANTEGFTNYTYPYDLPTIMDITNPLGVPLHPIDIKGMDFNSWVSYVGFTWDLELHTVSLSIKKHLKYLAKICHSLHVDYSSFSQKECMSILGTLQHISFIYKEGCLTLPPFTSFIAKFPNDFTCRHAPKPIIEGLCWWEAILEKI